MKDRLPLASEDGRGNKFDLPSLKKVTTPCHFQELKELNQWPLFLVTFRLDYASFLTEMEVDVKLFTSSGGEHQRTKLSVRELCPGSINPIPLRGSANRQLPFFTMYCMALDDLY